MRRAEFLLIAFLVAATSDTVSQQQGSCEVSANGEETCVVNQEPRRQCSLYMAPSTIAGAGLGVFTGTDRQIDEVIGTGDVMFPLVDVAYHLQHLGDKVLESEEVVANPTLHYIWFGPEMGMSQETSHPFVQTEYVSAFAPGLDAAINCHLGLDNLEKKIPIYDTAGLHRSKDPGAGGFTPYHKCDTYVTHPIPAGGELFKHYGDRWFKGRVDVFGLIPLTEDYPNAEHLVQEFDALTKRIQEYNTGVHWSDEIKWDLWKIISGFGIPSRLINALPKSREDYQTVLHEGIRAMIQPAATKSLEELDQTGRCLDYMEARPSTVRQAGRGSFATQFLPKGTIVTGSPLLIALTDDVFKMYEGNWWKKDVLPDTSHVAHYQILYNYCWHHNESSIFLCPYGVGINYINHGKSTVANVKLRWAKDGEMGHKEKLLFHSPKYMASTPAPGLFVDVVATRDIAEDEEIFLDYGPAWETAWEEHVANWDKYKHAEDYQSARDWSIENADAVLRTEKEQEDEPYPSHFELKCIHDIEDPNNTREKALELWEEDSYPGNPCRIIDRRKVEETGEYMYKVLYKELDRTDVSYQTLTTVDKLEWTESPWVVRAALRFVDVPYSTDLWLPGAFRHPIAIPDQIFPDAWRGQFLSLT